jgi:transposase
MSQRQKDPLRSLSEEEERVLKHLSRSKSQPAVHVSRARALLAGASGQSDTQAAERAGSRVGDTVGKLVSRLNQEGVMALQPQHAGGTPTSDGGAETERLLAEVRRSPDQNADGTATWSLSFLKATLRQAPDGLPHGRTYTIWCVLQEAGYRWQKDRTWCETGGAKRTRTRGVFTVRDPESVAKKK